jgi:hypothetical protein
MDYEIEDVIQENLNMTSFFLIKDIILLVMGFVLYSSLDFHWLTVSIKAFFIIIVLRYIISYLTTITEYDKNDRGTKYFQISANLSLFMIFCYIFYINQLYITNYATFNLLIVSYSILLITVKSNFTSDTLFTYLFMTFMYNLSLFKNLFM